MKNDVLSGLYGEKSAIVDLEKQGYELVTNNYPTGHVFGTDEPTYTVVLKHKVTDVTPNKPGQPGKPVDLNNPDGRQLPLTKVRGSWPSDFPMLVHSYHSVDKLSYEIQNKEGEKDE